MIKEKIEIMSTTDDFKKLANTSELRFKRNLLTSLKKTLKPYVKFVNNDFKNDIEDLQGCIDYLNNLFNSYAGKNKCNEIETIDTCLMIMVKIVIYILLTINNINHFLISLYYHLMDI